SKASLPRTSVAGRYAFDWGAAGSGKETTDGGMSWSVVDLSSAPLEGSARTSAACGPVGASEGGTREGRPGTCLPVGWGSSSDAPDLVLAAAPQPPSFKLPMVRGESMRCAPTGEVAGTPPPKPEPAKKPPAQEKKTIVAKASIVPAPVPAQPV